MKQRLEDFVRECHGRADAGHPESQYDLGILYSTGKGVPLDYIIAHKWFNLAAAASIPEARPLRGDIASQMSKERSGRGPSRRPPVAFRSRAGTGKGRTRNVSGRSLIFFSCSTV